MKGKEVGNESNLNLSQTSIGMPDGDLSDSISVSGKLGQKGDFDRRQKKKWVYDHLNMSFCFIVFTLSNMHYALIRFISCKDRRFLAIA